MKTKFLLAALTVALTTSLAVVAADTPAKDPAAPTEPPAKAGPAKAEPVKRKVKPHSHVEAKGGTVTSQTAEAKEQPGKPLHDHQKVHKQM